MIWRLLFASVTCTALAAAQSTIGPYLVHSVPGGPSLTKSLPASFVQPTTSWSMYAYVNASMSDQTVAIAGWGSIVEAGFREIGLDRGNPILKLGSTQLRSNAPLTTGWHLLAATCDNGSLHFFVDSMEVSSASVTAAQVSPQIEISPNGTDKPNTSFAGKSAFYVVDHALTSEDIRDLNAHQPDLDVALFEENAKPWPLQQKQRLGEDAPQSPDEMPHGAPPQKPVAMPLPAPAASLDPTGNGVWELHANWRLLLHNGGEHVDGKSVAQANFDDHAWLPAIVPGTVLTTLIERGVYPNPDYGLNNLAIPESLNKHDDWYRVQFPSLPHTAGQRVHLQFGGVSYAAEFFLNGVRLGSVEGAFQRAAFDVTALLRKQNSLAVRILPPPHPGIPQEQSLKGGPGYNGGAMVLDGPGFMSTEGWDWLPAIRDRDMGIWQPVSLAVTGAVTLGDPQIITHLPLPDTSRATVEIHLPVHNSAASSRKVDAVVDFEGQHVTLERFVPAGDSTLDFPKIVMLHPRLWWPNGYGKPNLYHAKIRLLDGAAGAVSDHREVTFGVREVTVELSLFDHTGSLRRVEVDPVVARSEGISAVDVLHDGMRNTKALWAASLTPEGERGAAVRDVTDEPNLTDLVIKVNGVRVAVRGGNWGLDDSRKRVSRERMEPYFRLERDANLNIIRNWQGQNTEEIFYQLADEYGLMVWNDFWMATENSNPAPDNPDLLLANARDTVRRYRNHPSIVLWCGRNEGVPPPYINESLVSMLREEDGTRYYTPSSNRINLRPSGPYQWQPPGDYYSKLNRGFSVELGTSSFPTLEAFNAMMPVADRWPISDDWAYHDWHQARGGDTHTFMKEMVTQFGAPDSLEAFERRAQMFNYVDHQAIFEGFYQHLWDPNSGRLLWMTHPSWPSTMWQIYSSDYDTQASYFAVKHANEPLHPQMDMSNGALAVVNTTLIAHKGMQLHAHVVDLANKSLYDVVLPVDAVANRTTALQTLPLTQIFARASLVLIRLELQDNSGRSVANNFYWIGKDDNSYRALTKLAPANVAVTYSPTSSGLRFHLRNQGNVPAIEVKLTLEHPDGARILPAYWSDNYINLLPGEDEDVDVEFSGETSPHVTMRAWNMESQAVQ